MTSRSTTIRVSQAQRMRLKTLAEHRSASMTETLDAALEALRRDDFYRSMATSEQQLRADPDAWEQFDNERNAWLDAQLT